jgi:tRNA (guanine-N7-)-methyltransferase
MMRRGSRVPMEELAPFLFEAAIPRHGVAREFATRLHLAESDYRVPPLDWSRVFGNVNPVEIEVGFGKGLFLVNSGCGRPGTNFFGIEIERKYTLFTATRLAKRGLRNVKVAACDARWFLEAHVKAGSVAAVHVYFPDPWWKNRHRKRRLFTEPFAAQCARVLASGGHLHFVSDVETYFAETALMLAQIDVLAPSRPPEVKDPEHEMDFLTNFERKYRRQGRSIHRGLWRRS